MTNNDTYTLTDAEVLHMIETAPFKSIGSPRYLELIADAKARGLEVPEEEGSFHDPECECADGGCAQRGSFSDGWSPEDYDGWQDLPAD
jgi:hypothetical protein